MKNVMPFNIISLRLGSNKLVP